MPPPTGWSEALRALLEERFQLKVTRATEQRDMYALTIASGGLRKDRIAVAPTGDCQTNEQYAAAVAAAPERTLAERLADGNPRLCGRTYSGRDDNGFYLEYTSVTLGQLATDLSRQLDYVVVDRTNTAELFNFVLRQRPSPTIPQDVHRASELAAMGITLEPVRGPAEYLRIDRVQPLRAGAPAATK
jgi:uncharacterized protein (TIGR03435 family)